MKEVVKVNTVNVGMINTNCYIVYKENIKEALIIDPGDEAYKVFDKVKDLGVTPVAVLLTHGHFDHILAAKEVANNYGIKIYASKEEKRMLAEPTMNLSYEYTDGCSIEEYIELDNNQHIEIAQMNIRIMYTPGHTKGSICFLIEDADILFSGDMLFRECVGRTDLETGSHKDIIHSLNNILMKLEDGISVYPGHGPSTTIGYERINNEYVI